MLFTRECRQEILFIALKYLTLEEKGLCFDVWNEFALIYTALDVCLYKIKVKAMF